MKKQLDISLLALTLALTLAYGTLVIVRPANTYSEEERRALAQKPTLSAKSIVSGELTEELSGNL